MPVVEKSIYTLCTEVLGTGWDSHELQRIFEMLNDKPETYSGKHTSSYFFLRSGIELMLTEPPGLFTAALFFVDIPDSQNGFLQAYADTLLAGVTTADSSAEMRRKIGLTPKHWHLSDDAWEDEYDLPAYRLQIHFDRATERMSLASISYKWSAEFEDRTTLKRPTIRQSDDGTSAG